MPVGEVLASPFCAVPRHGQIAFGRVDERMELLGLLSDEDGSFERIQFSLAALRRPVPEGTTASS